MAFVPIKCRIPELLYENKLSAQELAEHIGMSKQQISDYSNMRKVMSLTTAKLFAEYFMIPIDELYVWKKVSPRSGRQKS